MRKAARAHLESVVKDGDPGMEEAGVCSRKTPTVSGGGDQLSRKRRTVVGETACCGTRVAHVCSGPSSVS